MTKGEKIALLREERGMSQVDLAYKVGVSKQTMYKYENDIVTNIPSDKIELIADALRTSPGYLMGWEEGTFGEDVERELMKAPRNEKEEAIITLFRLLTPEQQKLVTDLIHSLAGAKTE